MAATHKSRGIGMKFWRKSWPKDSYFTVTEVHFENIRRGKAWGILTWEGSTESKEKEIRGVLKLGTWQHSEPDSEQPSLDNK
jgi:hypothetical protein